jgi:Fic family protein
MDYSLRIIQPAFTSPLTDIVIELEHLRRLRLEGDTPAPIFFQLKNIFHMMESLGSARIEGNHTTMADYIETKIDSSLAAAEPIREIANIETAMEYLETVMVPTAHISHQLIRELHHLTVQDLNREGDRTPGAYRQGNVVISGADHVPPDVSSVQLLMTELLDFVNKEDAPKYDLLKIALAHHRFAWIHPFSNGNGRVVRLFTYALLLKYGFNVNEGGRVLNPTAVFCNDRELYYTNLAKADCGDDAGLEAWSLYVLKGIHTELLKVDQLTRYDTLKTRILLPALTWSRSRGLIDEDSEKLLRLAVNKGEFKARDIEEVMPQLSSRQRTYQLTKMIDARMIQPVKPNTRTYTIQFTTSALIRGVMHMLTQEGFAPASN